MIRNLSTVCYAGIGSRETPSSVLETILKIGAAFAHTGYTLRSGGAKGADAAFEKGCDLNYGKKEILRSSDATLEAKEVALEFHPNPEAIKRNPYVWGLMGRNIQIISGRNLDQDVQFVICWTKDGMASGGTGQALRYAQSKEIRIFNLYYPAHLEELRKFYTENRRT